MKRLHFILILLTALGSHVNAEINSQITEKLDNLTQTLTKNTLAKKPATEKLSLAVLPFKAAEDLEKKRVGFAVAGLLLHHFIQAPEFTLVEWDDLQSALQEQKLQLSGATDPETAVKIGKLIGAKLLVLGNVEKLAGEYIIYARIVEVETREILATAHEAVPSHLFEEQTGKYLTPAPVSKTIGIYGFFNFSRNSNHLPVYRSATLASNYTDTTISSPLSFNLNVSGGGIRYFATPYIMVDVSIGTGRVMTYRRIVRNYSYTDSVTNITQSYNNSSDVGFKAAIVRGIVTYTILHGDKMRYFAGGGASHYLITAVPGYGGKEKVLVPAVSLGLEYKFQPRIALGLFVNYDYIKNVLGHNFFNPKDMQNFKLNNPSFTSTLTFYF